MSVPQLILRGISNFTRHSFASPLCGSAPLLGVCLCTSGTTHVWLLASFQDSAPFRSWIVHFRYVLTSLGRTSTVPIIRSTRVADYHRLSVCYHFLPPPSPFSHSIIYRYSRTPLHCSSLIYSSRQARPASVPQLIYYALLPVHPMHSEARCERYIRRRKIALLSSSIIGHANRPTDRAHWIILARISMSWGVLVPYLKFFSPRCPTRRDACLFYNVLRCLKFREFHTIYFIHI